MNIPEDVINRITIPTDPEDKFVYHSEWLTAAALTQTYGYMIENGLEYSKLEILEASDMSCATPNGRYGLCRADKTSNAVNALVQRTATPSNS